MFKKFTFLTFSLVLILALHVSAQDTTKVDYVGQSSKGDNPPLHYTNNPVDPNYNSTLPVYRNMLGDTTVIPSHSDKQYQKFEEGNYPFAPKPKNLWEVGVGAGTFFVSGDVKAQLGYGFSAHVRKSLGYTLSLEGLFQHGNAYGLNWEASSGLGNNPVLGDAGLPDGSPNPTDYYHNGGIVYHNFKMVNNDASINMVVTMNNIGFHRKSADRKLNIYGLVGLGMQNYAVWYNALDANGNRYDYLSVYNTELQNGVTKDDRKPTITALKAMLDNTYETAAEGHHDEESIFNRVMNPIANGGVSLAYRMSRRVNLELSHRVTFTQDDLEDGQRWQEWPNAATPVLTRDYDTYHYTSLNLNLNLGKSVEPLYWQNPLDFAYQTLQTLQQKNVDELVDTDGDGVLDKLDNEPNTPAGNNVDTHGVTLDSDKDGIPDSKDPYPYGGPFNTNVNTQTQTSGSNVCVMTKFPSVHFDLDKYYIKPEFYSSLYEVAFAMISCPDRKMVCTGHTDVREGNDYNMVLSWERVNKVVDYLVTTYGIDRSRFIIKYEGETKPRIPGLPDNSWAPVYEPRQYQNRRVEFRWADTGETGNSNPPKPNGPKQAGEDY